MSKHPPLGPPTEGTSQLDQYPVGQLPSLTSYLPLRPDGRPTRRRTARTPSDRDDRAGFAPEAPLADDELPSAVAPASSQPRARTLGAALLREHALFCSVLLAAGVVRIIVMLGYPPALWYPDSLRYVQAAVQPQPYSVRPVGYSFFLILLEPLHSIMAVTAVQHTMGLAVGIATYAVLRLRFRLPGWGATLAAVPPLLSAYGIQIEHFVLSDTFFGLLVTLAVVLLVWRPVPRVWMCALAGLLLAGAAVVRSQGLLLAIPFTLYLATQLAPRNTRFRVLAGIFAMCVTVAVPLLGYAWWFDQVNGSFQLTTSTGAFLYSRVAGFADCSTIRPPANERWLCLSTPVSQRQFEGYYVWASASPLFHGPAPEFSSKVNSFATDFALRAITTQPGEYLKAVWHSSFETFEIHRDPNPAGQSQNLYVFPDVAPESLKSLASANYENFRYSYSYNHGANPSTRIVKPYASWIRDYQRFMVVPGPLLGVIVLMGGLGSAVAWRRFGGPAMLPWLTGAVLIVTPAATADFDARYVVAAIPSFCIAAAIGMREVNHARQARKAGAGNGNSGMDGAPVE